MSNKIVAVLAAAFVSIAATLISLIYSISVRSEGFFSVYQGENYVVRGFPWGFLQCFDAAPCTVLGSRFFTSLLFWFVSTALLILVFNFVVKPLQVTT